jgi:predicted MFS family arabinose efflux permease
MKKHSLALEKLIIFILFFVQFTHMIDFVIMMPLGPKLVRFFSMTSQQFSVVVSSYAFSAAFSGLISSFFIDLFDRKKVLIFLYSGFLFANIFCALSVNYPMLIFARILAGSFGGVLAGLTFSIIGDIVPEERRGSATGIVMSAFGTASVIGIPLGLFLADHFNWHSPFWLISILSFAVIILMKLKMPSLVEHIQANKNRTESPLKHFFNLFKERNYQRAMILSFTYIMSGFLVIPFISQYMVRNVGLLENQLSYIYFFGGFFTLFTSRIFGKLSDKFGKHRILYILAPASIIPIFLITNIHDLTLIPTLLISTLFFILISGRYVPLMSIITSSVHNKNRGAFMVVNSSLQQIGMGIASAISGFIITVGTTGKIENFNIAGYLSIVFTCIFIFIATKVKINKD